MLSIPTYYKLDNIKLTQSLMYNYMLCDYRFLYALNLYEDDYGDMAKIGIFGHHLLEHVYGDRAYNLDKLVTEYDFNNEFDTDKQEYIRGTMWQLITAYVEQYPAVLDWDIKPELEFIVELNKYSTFGSYKRGTVNLLGKIDGVVEEKKDIWLVENKFKGQVVEENIEKKLKVDWQSLFYLNAYFLKYGKYPKGILYNVIRFPSKGYKKKGIQPVLLELQKEIQKNPEYYFHRWKVEFKESEIRSFGFDLDTHVAKLQDMLTTKTWTKNLCACDLPFMCPYIEACAGGTTDNLKRKHKLFPELDFDTTGINYRPAKSAPKVAAAQTGNAKPKLILSRKTVRK